MPLVTGLNHVAVLTQDLNRFIDFYTNVFNLEVVFQESTPTFRHAILRLGADSWLHPAQISGNPYSIAIPDMFKRGHLDHIALTAASHASFAIIRERLIERGASDHQVEDLGAFHSIWFEDPDGMHGEVTVIVDATLRGIHEPRPLASLALST